VSGHVLLRRAPELPALAKLNPALLASGLVQLQRTRTLHSHRVCRQENRQRVEHILRSFAHRDLCREIDGTGDSDLTSLVIAEQRTVTIVFCQIVGLEMSLQRGADGLPAIQKCIRTALGLIGAGGGLLRQLICDDKGTVLIWTFGLHGSTCSELGSRALLSCFEMTSALGALGLRTHIGLTSGGAYCGLVGAPYRAEYCVVGPSVNLAARLMVVCAAQGAGILCDTAIHQLLLSEQAADHCPRSTSRPSSPAVGSPATSRPGSPATGPKIAARMAQLDLTFEPVEPLTLKGYDEPVCAYRPTATAISPPHVGATSPESPSPGAGALAASTVTVSDAWQPSTWLGALDSESTSTRPPRPRTASREKCGSFRRPSDALSLDLLP